MYISVHFLRLFNVYKIYSKYVYIKSINMSKRTIEPLLPFKCRIMG